MSNTSGGHRFFSYQQGYQPPVHYAADQTRTMEDTTKTFHEADAQATQVLQHMRGQRQQIQGAHNDVYEMRQATEKAKRELEALQKKYREKKQRLYVMIAILSLVDTLLFFRILQCGGNFFC